MGGTIYALAGGKGGVGRTTTAVNTGIALEAAGYNTVVVDGDVAMTGATTLLDVQAESGVHGILAGTDSINDAVVDGPSGLTFVSGDPSLEAFAEIDEAKLGRVVEPLAAAHDVVLVDTPPGLRPLHRDAYERADGTILLATPDDAALSAAEKTATVVDHVGGCVLGVGATMAGPEGAKRVESHLDVPLVAVIPESSAAADEGIVEDGPVVEGYEQLADAIGTHADGEDVDAVSPESALTATTASETTTATTDSETIGTADDGGALDGLRARLGQDEDVEEVEFDEDEDALEVLFQDSDDSDDSDQSGSRLGDLSDRLSDVSDTEALRDRIQSNGEGTDDADEVEFGEDEDPLDALFTDDE